MKLITNKPAFTPKEITFVFETQAELDVIAALFSHGKICRSMEESGLSVDVATIIRNSLKEFGANYESSFAKIADSIRGI